jgi:hypothetical protein
MSIIGHVDYISRSFVQGWVCDSDKPGQRISVVVKVNGAAVATAVADRARAGLHQATQGKAQDDTEFRIDFEPPLSVFDRQDVEVVTEEDGKTLPNGRRIIPAPRLAQAGVFPIEPLLLTSTGRSGSTMMMNEFGHHPGIVTADRYPFEIKQIAYYAAAFRNLVLDADRTNSTHPESMLSEKLKTIGSNPYYTPGFFDLAQPKSVLQEFFEAEIPNQYAALFQRLILRFYGLLVASDAKKASARYFCEKGDVSRICRDGARLFFGRVKEIVLVRDPRALLTSAIAFWKLPPYEALEMLRTTIPQLEDACDGPAGETLVIRYEDLVLEPKDTRRQISGFLGIELADTASASDVKAGHRTSSDPLQSISRWREDLTPSLIAECESGFGDFLRRFGYAGPQGGQRMAPVQTDCVGGSLRVVADGAAATKDILGRKAFPVVQAGRETIIYEHSFGKSATGNELLGQGWSALEDGGVWSRENACHLALPGPAVPGRYALQLCLAPFTHATALASQRLGVTCCGTDLGTVALSDLSIVSGEIELRRGFLGETLPVVFRLPDAAQPSHIKGGPDTRLLGVSLRRLALIQMAPSSLREEPLVSVVLPPTIPSGLRNVPGCGAAPADSIVPPAHIDRGAAKRMMYRFESLGENCEFGLVQRKLGAEPAGLLRFASAPVDRLITALDADFQGMGVAGQIEIERADKEYMVFDKRFGFRYHAWVKLGEKEPSQIVQDELARVPVLIEKMMEDLTSGQKIFVFHGMRPLAMQQAERLCGAIRRHGPGTLLWVELANDANLPGTVTQLGPGFLKAYIDRFAPGENAYDFSLNTWLTICNAALATQGLR